MDFSIYITKNVEGHPVGQWVDLPISEDELNTIKYELSVSEVSITNYEFPVSCSPSFLEEYENIETLNELLKMVNSLSTYEKEKVGAILESEFCNDLDELFNIVEELDEFDLYSDVYTDEHLGLYLILDCDDYNEVPEFVTPYINYEAYGRDVRFDSSLAYTSYGCIVDNR